MHSIQLFADVPDGAADRRSKRWQRYD